MDKVIDREELAKKIKECYTEGEEWAKIKWGFSYQVRLDVSDGDVWCDIFIDENSYNVYYSDSIIQLSPIHEKANDRYEYSIEKAFLENAVDALEEAGWIVTKPGEAIEKPAEEPPVYLHNADYAKNAGEMDLYQASHLANQACRDAIEEAIERNFSSNHFDSKRAVQEVMEEYGAERTLHVVANSIRHYEHDGRISWELKAWAKSMPADEPSQDRFGRDQSVDYLVDQCNPGLLDLFAKQSRREAAELQPEKPKEARQEEKKASAPKM